MCREAGGHLQSGFLRDFNLGQALPSDNKRLECVVNGLQANHGRQVAVDNTGEPTPTQQGAQAASFPH